MNKELNQISNVKQSIITAMCIALCVVLPLIFHSIPQAGNIYCPMHIPVLICGLVCNPPFAVLCGIAGPIISSIITGMPSILDMPSMITELVIYGLVCSLIMKTLKSGKIYVDVYVSLICAMILGRIAAGAITAFIFARGTMTISTWATVYFLTSLPGIIIQLILIPAVYFALTKANLIPAKYIIDDYSEEEDW